MASREAIFSTDASSALFYSCSGIPKKERKTILPRGGRKVESGLFDDPTSSDAESRRQKDAVRMEPFCTSYYRGIFLARDSSRYG